MGWQTDFQHTLTYPFTKIGVSQGDLEKALGTSTIKSHARLIGDLDANGNRANRTWPLALWKPFQHSTVVFSDLASRRAAMREVACGFRQWNSSNPTSLPTFTPASWALSNDNSWTYYPPVQGTHPMRAEDFAPEGTINGLKTGYRNNAPSPIVVTWPNFRESNPFVLIQVGSESRTSLTGGWDRNNCICIEDILPSTGSYATYVNYHFAILMYRSSYRDIVISHATVANCVSTYSGDIAIPINKSSINVLTGITAGDTVNCCVCLVEYSGTISQNSSVVIHAGASNFPGTAVSLEIASGCDRLAVVYPGQGSITDMSVSTNALTTASYTPSPVSGYAAWKICPSTALSISYAAGSSWAQLDGVSGVIKIWVEDSAALLAGDNGFIGTTLEIPYTVSLSAGQSKTDSYVFGNNIYGVSGGTGGNTPFTFYALKLSSYSSRSITIKVQVTFTYGSETKSSTTQSSTY